MINNPIIIPSQAASVGDAIEYAGQTFSVDKHFAQGKDMKGLDYLYIMFNEKGAFGLVVVE